MTPRQAASVMGIQYDAILLALRDKRIHGKKHRGRWYIRPRHIMRKMDANNEKLSALRNRYISLYWQGMTVLQLQDCVSGDFKTYEIICPEAGFAERTIYDAVKRNKAAP